MLSLFADGHPLNKLAGHWMSSLYRGSQTEVANRLTSLAYQLAAGLQHIHCMGILHQDIKPPNIIITLNFEVKIIDFGLARRGKIFVEDGHKSVAAPLSGSTKGYQSPEVRSHT